MSSINYQTMSKQELKKYFLEHREDKKALAEYLDRRHQNIEPITKADDPLFDSKIQAAIEQQIDQKKRLS